MIFAGIGFGFHKAAKEQKRLEQGIAIKRMLYLLQGEIRYGFTQKYQQKQKKNTSHS